MATQNWTAGYATTATANRRALRGSFGRACLRRRRAAPAAPRGLNPSEVAQFAPLVKRVAMEVRRTLPPHVELDDLIGDGTVGLMEAAVKFDPAKRVDFNAYARHRIRGAILDALRNQDQASRGLRKKIKQAENAGRKLEARLARPVRAEEISRELGISIDAWYKMSAEADRATEAPVPLVENLEERCSESLAAPGNDDAFQQCYRAEQRRILAGALGCLEERERRLIRLYYFEARTMKAIGKSLGVDESRISQLHSRAIKRLQECVQARLGRGQVPGDKAA